MSFPYLFLCMIVLSLTSISCILRAFSSPVPPITFPVFHKALEISTPRTSRFLLNSSSSVPSLESSLTTLNEPSGQYFALLHLGSPPSEIAVIVDTGSQFLWVQCSPCVQCGTQIRDPIFNPSLSSSFKPIACDTQNQTQSQCGANDSVETACDASGECVYGVQYGDNSTSSGLLALETLTIGTANGGSPFQLQDVVFGCGTNNTGVEDSLNASGLMGLDRGEFSVPVQFRISVFSYCFPDRVKNVQATGYLTFGKSTNSASSKLQYTPLIQNNESTFLSQFYYLGMTGISVNGKLLDIPSSAFDLVAGQGGTVIDSGTTLSSFVEEAYNPLTSAFASAMNPSVQRATGSDFDGSLCYQVPLNQLQPPTAPSVTFHFAGSVNLDLQTDHLFRLIGSDSTNNYYCMAFTNAGNASDAKNFFGNYQQQNFFVEYDVGSSRIGFAPTQCSHGNFFNIRQSYMHLLWAIVSLLLLLNS